MGGGAHDAGGRRSHKALASHSADPHSVAKKRVIGSSGNNNIPAQGLLLLSPPPLDQPDKSTRRRRRKKKKKIPLDKARPLRNFQRPSPFVQLPDGKVQGSGPLHTHSLVW